MILKFICYLPVGRCFCRSFCPKGYPIRLVISEHLLVFEYSAFKTKILGRKIRPRRKCAVPLGLITLMICVILNKSGTRRYLCKSVSARPRGLSLSLCITVLLRTYLLPFVFVVTGYHFLLRAERGLTISLQSRSPRSRAFITTSAVAMFVATGMLLRSQILSNSLPA